MRVNPDLYGDIAALIGEAEQRSQTALRQVSSGLRVHKPSDDPAAFSGWIQNRTDSQRIDQFHRNISSIEAMLNTADSALSTVVTRLSGAVNIGVQGANGTISDADRQSLAAGVTSIRDEIVQLANTTYQGAYIFAGTTTTKAPFVTDAAGNVSYTGNEQVNSVQIDASRSIAVNVPGDRIFQNGQADVMSSLDNLVAALQSGGSTDISEATNDVRSALAQVSQQRVAFGAHLQDLQDTDSYLQKETLDLQNQENTLVGADLATAVTQFTAAQTAQSATMAAAAKITPLSLMDYLK